MIDYENDRSDPIRPIEGIATPDGAMRSRLAILRRALTAGFSVIVFVASAWYIGRTFKWRELGQVLKDVNLMCLLVGGGASISAGWVLRTLRWHVLLRRTGTNVPLLDLHMCTAVSLGFALVTPLQSGEVLKIELLKKYGLIQRSPGYGSFFVEKALDTLTLVAMAGVSLLTTTNILSNRTYAYYILGGLVVFGAAGLVMLTRHRFRGRAQQLMEHMHQCVSDVPTLLLVIAITGAFWASVALSWQIFLYSGGVHLDFAKAAALMSIVALVSIASLIPGGMGVTEIGTSQLLIYFGFAAVTAQAGSLVLRSLSLVAIALGAAHFGFWKLFRSRRKRLFATGRDVTESSAAEADSLVR